MLPKASESGSDEESSADSDDSDEARKKKPKVPAAPVLGTKKTVPAKSKIM